MASISECLNKIDDMIFDNYSKIRVKNGIEDIRKHIERKHCTIPKEDDRETVTVLSLLYQINKIIEELFSDDTKEDFDEHYNHLRRDFSEWYEVIDEINKIKYLD